MISQLGWSTLQHRRENSKMIMVRITNYLIDIPPVSFFHHLTLGGHGYGHRFLIPFCRTDVLKYSFFPSAIKLEPATVAADHSSKPGGFQEGSCRHTIVQE
ncbi:hypothetical protein DPMN_032682 [Dreissena polymorpha]|uniref:Uncharacterized protein n=1 Tax=Dreissena polymorpha TaxID=45954 RepID=A0A9D4M3D5_DREPO|nr:hypothetical protein DPMN_032682 [Dreissena polymorpha]